MRKPGAVTVFLSLVLVCILSLLMGLLESARTVGARLYFQMAADSAMASVMSQYNRNLWEMYDLLFLEYESAEAVTRSFEEFFSYYEEQENLYPLELEEVQLGQTVKLTANSGEALEREITDYIRYRLPEAAADLAGLTQEAAQAAAAGEFENLLTVCRQAGRSARRLEKKRAAVEDSLREMEKLLEKTARKAEQERKGAFLRNGRKLRKKMEGFSGLVDAYETEIERLRQNQEQESGQQTITQTGTALQIGKQEEEEISGWEDGNFMPAAAVGLQKTGTGAVSDTENGSQPGSLAQGMLSQEISACGQVIEAAQEALADYREKEQEMEAGRERLEEALALAGDGGAESDDEAGDGEDAGDEEDSDEDELDWSEIQAYMDELVIPEAETMRKADEEKSAALDRLEELFDQELLGLVLPAGSKVSSRKLPGVQTGSGQLMKNTEESDGTASLLAGADEAVSRLLVGEYILLFFDSFQESGEGGVSAAEKPLQYEQEYLLNGEKSDRENLSGTVQRLISIRGAANLLYLLNTPEKKTQADALAAAVTAGAAPVQFIVSLFILTLWAFGEAILDVRALMAGGSVSLWKDSASWQISLEGLLSLEFLSGERENGTGSGGLNYAGYMRILFFLEDRGKRNLRMADLIERNVQKKQADFSVEDCAWQTELTVRVRERHIFLLTSEYTDHVTVSCGY